MGSEVRVTGLGNRMNYKFAVVNKKLNHNSYKIFIHPLEENEARYLISDDITSLCIFYHR